MCAIGLEYCEVSGIVILWIPVYVVDYFFRMKETSKFFLHYQTMLGNITLLCAIRMIWRIYIPISFHESPASFPRVVMLFASSWTGLLGFYIVLLAVSINGCPAYLKQFAGLFLCQLLDFNQVTELVRTKVNLSHWVILRLITTE